MVHSHHRHRDPAPTDSLAIAFSEHHDAPCEVKGTEPDSTTPQKHPGHVATDPTPFECPPSSAPWDPPPGAVRGCWSGAIRISFQPNKNSSREKEFHIRRWRGEDRAGDGG